MPASTGTEERVKPKEALSEGVRLFSLSRSLLTAMEIPGTLHLGFLLAL